MTGNNVVWSGCVISNIGLKRPNNEDNFLLDGNIREEAFDIDKRLLVGKRQKEDWQCAAVFDGMGGGENGERAAFFAAEEIRKILQKSKSDTTEATIEKLMRQSFLNANQRIVKERSCCSVLGTTAAVVCFQKNRLKAFHLGDSRVYLLRGERLYQLTKDQTLANLRVTAGCYNACSPEAERDSHFLTEYIGADETLVSLRPVESEWITVKPKDKLLLCSDGLYRGCRERRMKEILLGGRNAEELADALTCQALQAGGEDNITCVVLTVEAENLQAGGEADGN